MQRPRTMHILHSAVVSRPPLLVGRLALVRPHRTLRWIARPDGALEAAVGVRVRVETWSQGLESELGSGVNECLARPINDCLARPNSTVVPHLTGPGVGTFRGQAVTGVAAEPRVGDMVAVATVASSPLLKSGSGVGVRFEVEVEPRWSGISSACIHLTSTGPWPARLVGPLDLGPS